MTALEDFLQRVSPQLDPSIHYIVLLRKTGHHTPNGILSAGSAEILSKDCGLLMRDARIIWEAAGGKPGGSRAHTGLT